MPRRVIELIVALAFIGAPSISVSVRGQTTGIREVSASARSVIKLRAEADTSRMPVVWARTETEIDGAPMYARATMSPTTRRGIKHLP